MSPADYLLIKQADHLAGQAWRQFVQQRDAASRSAILSFAQAVQHFPAKHAQQLQQQQLHSGVQHA